MVNTDFLSSESSTLGDQNLRDVYIRNEYQRSSGDIGSHAYTLSSSTLYQTVSRLQTLNSDSSGSYKVFLRKSTDSATTIDTSSVSPILTVNASQTLIDASNLKATGSFSIGSVTTSLTSTTLTTSFPVDGSVTTMSINDTSGSSLASIDENGNVSFAGSLAVTSDFLAASDCTIAGDTTMYGSVSIIGDQSSNISNLFLTGTSAGSGFYVGGTTSSAVASILYSSTLSMSGGASFTSSIPLSYAGSTTTAEVGNGGTVCVYKTASSSENLSMSSNALTLSNTWRLRFDESTNGDLVFEYYDGTAWSAKSIISV